MGPLSSTSAEQTFALGVALGESLLAGDFVGLNGQLGAGKTLFSRGVAQGGRTSAAGFQAAPQSSQA